MTGEVESRDESGTAISESERTALLLRRAADRLEGLAGQAMPGPWVVTAGEHGMSDIEMADGRLPVVLGEGDGACSGQNAAWIAAMSPVVAAPLVAWLRSEAAEALDHVRAPGDPEHRSLTIARLFAPAVEFARLVLGASPDASETGGAESAGDGSGGSGPERPLAAPGSAERPQGVAQDVSGVPDGSQTRGGPA